MKLVKKRVIHIHEQE